MIDLRNIVFMDFEASAGRDGFPVEVGWAWIENSSVFTEAMLIAPADEWLTPAYTWDPIAESIHGLSLSGLISNGLSTGHVCRTLNRQLQDRVVVFDTGPDGVDRHWMDILFSESAEARSFKLGGPAGEVLKAVANELRVSEARQTLIRAAAPPMTHRAAADAVHYAWRAAAIQLSSKLPGDAPLDQFGISVLGKIR